MRTDYEVFPIRCSGYDVESYAIGHQPIRLVSYSVFKQGLKNRCDACQEKYKQIQFNKKRRDGYYLDDHEYYSLIKETIENTLATCGSLLKDWQKNMLDASLKDVEHKLLKSQ